MENNKKENSLLIVAMVTVFFLAALGLIFQAKHIKSLERLIELKDTVTVTDTIIQDETVYIPEVMMPITVIGQRDTLYKQEGDSVIQVPLALKKKA